MRSNLLELVVPMATAGLAAFATTLLLPNVDGSWFGGNFVRAQESRAQESIESIASTRARATAVATANSNFGDKCTASAMSSSIVTVLNGEKETTVRDEDFDKAVGDNCTASAKSEASVGGGAPNNTGSSTLPPE